MEPHGCEVDSIKGVQGHEGDLPETACRGWPPARLQAREGDKVHHVGDQAESYPVRHRCDVYDRLQAGQERTDAVARLCSLQQPSGLLDRLFAAPFPSVASIPPTELVAGCASCDSVPPMSPLFLDSTNTV